LVAMSRFTRRRPSSPVFAYTTLFRSPVEGTLRLPKLVPNYLERIGEALEGATVRWGGDTALADRLRALGQGPSARAVEPPRGLRSEEHTSELQSREKLVCRLLLAKKK